DHRGRKRRPVRSVTTVFDFGIGAPKSTHLQQMIAAYLGQVVLHRIQILMISIRSDVPEGGLTLRGSIRIQAAPSAKELARLLDGLRERGRICGLQRGNDARPRPRERRNDG